MESPLVWSHPIWTSRRNYRQELPVCN